MRLLKTLSCCCLAFFASVAIASAAAHDATDSHAHHQDAAASSARITADYIVPDVQLVRDDGSTVKLTQELNDGRAVVLGFIFTSCTSICPLSSQTFAELQAKLGPDRAKVHLVSISIDPEEDTPVRLREYARRFDAGPGWQHYTGTLAASRTVQRAFNADRGGKMNHAPVTFVRAAPGARWIRIDGFASADQLANELRAVMQ